MTKVLSINTFGALVSSLCTFIFKKKKENKKSLLFSSLISCCTTRLLLHKPGHKEGSKSRHTDFSTSPFPPSCCLQQKQLREVSRRLCRLPSPSILYLTVPDCRPCALHSLDVLIQWISLLALLPFFLLSPGTSHSLSSIRREQ